ncbi:MAG TPA: sigma-54 dependent transcriptional regulator [Bryobacteraceae bacterium]|nr:sigma-54 dependent transcriptional regulator [Bryobacteraceae bacterium]
MSANVLVVDDDARERADLAEMVSAFGFDVATAADGREALEKLASFPVNAILTDLMMPCMDGIELLKELAAHGDRTPTIVLTAFGSIDRAISIVHDLKAFWFLEKPVQPGVMRALLERAIQQSRLVAETERLSRQLSYQGVLGDMVGDSSPMKEVFSLIRQVAPTTASVLITGESGTGKELVARAIHRLSPRSGGPFVAVNCAALPESLVESELFGHEKGSFTGAAARSLGCFEQAQNGTLLLDEIGEMPIATQAKLLRVIEESKVRRLGGGSDIPISVRVLAATNRSPEKAIEEKHLREDLYYRLNVFHISLPPLRERKQDIPSIAAALIGDLNEKHDCRVTHLSSDVLARFEANPWPGNVRELRNVIERAVIVAGKGEVQLQHLPGAFAPRAPKAPLPQNSQDGEDVLTIRAGAQMREVEEAYIGLVLRHTGNNKRRAAKVLGICLRTLHGKLRSFEGRSTQGAAGAAAGS